jgi:hypothetical protein
MSKKQEYHNTKATEVKKKEQSSMGNLEMHSNT